jgi:hypothetical protein
MNLELNNPSAFHALRVSSQDRARNAVDKAPTAPAPKKALSRSELEAIGSEIVMVPSKGTAREGGVMKAVTRDVPTPFYKTAGFESLAEFCTEQGEKSLRESQHAAAAIVPRGERVVDTWGALQPRLSVPPGGKVLIPLEEHTRLAITCEEPVTLQLSNTSTSRTLRLRTLDTVSGAQANVSFLAPAKEWPSSSIVSADAHTAAIVEMMAT